MNIRFVSGKCRVRHSPVSRYRRLRLGALRARLTCLRLRFWFLTGSNHRKKKTKTRQALIPFQSAHCAREVPEEIATCRLPLCSLRLTYAQPPLAWIVNSPPHNKGCITGKMGVLIGERTPNAHPVPQSTCLKSHVRHPPSPIQNLPGRIP